MRPAHLYLDLVTLIDSNLHHGPFKKFFANSLDPNQARLIVRPDLVHYNQNPNYNKSLMLPLIKKTKIGF